MKAKRTKAKRVDERPRKIEARVGVRKVGADGRMNRLEAEYSRRLEVLRVAGEIRKWRYEPVTFFLAKRTRYTPDFEVIDAKGLLEYHEVKGGIWKDDARAKIKMAAYLYPERLWVGVTFHRGSKRSGKPDEWRHEVF